MVDLKAKPFFLKDEDIRWVEHTLADMTVEEKAGQLFCLVQREDDAWKEEADRVLKYKPNGTQFRPLKAETAWKLSGYYQDNSKIPMLIPANLERGGSGIAKEGTVYADNMQVAATGDPEMARRQGLISAREALAVGGNWAFAPCIDLDYNWRNPITNTRTYGSDPDVVIQMSKAYIDAVQSMGVAACIKHFPGDGMDERDQHLVTTVNSMSCKDWDATYGRVYQECIDAGVLTVMVGHIQHPEYSRKLRPGIKDEDILPATLAPELMNGLLREKLGFNGLIVTDASTMVGMLMSTTREKSVPYAIAAGCDMYLFTRNLEEDYEYMKKGIREGIITPQRLNDALTRILALKAALGLHKKQKTNSLVPPASGLSIIGCEEHKKWTRECADKAVTLIKSDGTLPINPKNGKRLLLYILGDEEGYMFVGGGKSAYFKEKLEKEGFAIDVFDRSRGMEGRMRRYDEVVNKYDLVIYFCALLTKSNQSTVRIQWAEPFGADAPIYVPSIPTIFISTENPYHLLDVPRVKTFINGYTNTEEVIDAIIEKLMGRSAFRGESPVDVFCGRWDTRL